MCLNALKMGKVWILGFLTNYDFETTSTLRGGGVNFFRIELGDQTFFHRRKKFSPLSIT